ncbi:hypothetical protein QE152_g36248 [Popillia japonica]|uniref:Knr4/Smi1-like domain-containing protein n=1 Tax=Popillia japonica TaxID=7064 RepID=A0AAW1IDR0_POPJA
MEFILETLTPDTFYQNLLLGLPNILRKFKKYGMRKTHLTRFLPASQDVVSAWENMHEVLMPDDMKNFYCSTNGFLYQWSCTYGSKNEVIIGKLDINSVENLVQVAGYRTKAKPGVSLSGTAYLIRLGYASKVFEICILANNDKVCLVYLDRKYVPTVWICTHDFKFHFLADSFTKYLCMAITHLGFPNWQLLYLPQGVPKSSAALMQLMCPSVVLQNRRAKTVETMRNQRILKAQTNYDSAVLNVLDPKVFALPSYRKQLVQNFIKMDDKENKSARIDSSPTRKRVAKSKWTNRKTGSKTIINLRSKKIK